MGRRMRPVPRTRRHTPQGGSGRGAGSARSPPGGHSGRSGRGVSGRRMDDKHTRIIAIPLAVGARPSPALPRWRVRPRSHGAGQAPSENLALGHGDDVDGAAAHSAGMHSEANMRKGVSARVALCSLAIAVMVAAFAPGVHAQVLQQALDSPCTTTRALHAPDCAGLPAGG